MGRVIMPVTRTVTGHSVQVLRFLFKIIKLKSEFIFIFFGRSVTVSCDGFIIIVIYFEGVTSYAVYSNHYTLSVYYIFTLVRGFYHKIMTTADYIYIYIKTIIHVIFCVMTIDQTVIMITYVVVFLILYSILFFLCPCSIT